MPNALECHCAAPQGWKGFVMCVEQGFFLSPNRIFFLDFSGNNDFKRETSMDKYKADQEV